MPLNVHPDGCQQEAAEALAAPVQEPTNKSRFQMRWKEDGSGMESYDTSKEPAPTSEAEPQKLTRNAVRCLRCNDQIESKHRHDFVTCSCGNISVDGGLAYQRLAGKALDDGSWADLSEREPAQQQEREG